MPVINTVDRVGRIIANTLEGLASDDDLVEYAVTSDVVVNECDEESSEDAPCPECGGRSMTSVVGIYLSIDCPETNAHSTVHFYTPIKHTYDEDALRDAITESWEQLTFKRQAYALEEGLLAASTDGASDSPPGTPTP